MASTFTFIPEDAVSVSKTPRVLIAQFGDGYSQRVGDGLNTMAETWSLTFSYNNPTDRDAVDSFLTAQAGTTYFLWTPPFDAVQKKYICSSWQKTSDNTAVFGLTAVFQQCFDL